MFCMIVQYLPDRALIDDRSSIIATNPINAIAAAASINMLPRARTRRANDSFRTLRPLEKERLGRFTIPKFIKFRPEIPIIIYFSPHFPLGILDIWKN